MEKSEVRSKVLDVFKELRKQGFLARAKFLCCQSCAGYELATRAEAMLTDGKNVKGAVFWTRQDEESFWRTGRLYLSYGEIHTTGFGRIGLSTKEIGKLVCNLLSKFGVSYEWNGSPDERIMVKA